MNRLAWAAQTVHQAHHEGPLADCTQSTCRALAADAEMFAELERELDDMRHQGGKLVAEQMAEVMKASKALDAAADALGRERALSAVLLGVCRALYGLADPCNAESEETFLATCEQARAAMARAEEVR